MSGLKFRWRLAMALSTPMAGRDDSDQDDLPPRETATGRLPEQLFTALNLAVFLGLLACVVFAAVLWELGH